MRKKNKILPYLYLLPALLTALVFTYYPFIKTIVLSMSVVDASGSIVSFAWFDNFRYLFTYEPFHIALSNTLRLAAFFVPINCLFALFLAVLSNKKRKLSIVYESLFMLPMGVSMPSAALIFKVILSPLGIVNQLLHSQSGWFSDKNTALLSILILCVWMGFSFDFLLIRSALRGIPRSLIEASALEGASASRRFFWIELPYIAPTLLYVVFTNIAQVLMIAGPMMIITEGGPSRATSSLIYLMFVSGYESSNYGLASAIAIVTFGLTFVLCALALYFENKRTKIRIH